MKKISVIILIVLVSCYAFGQESEKPIVMYEIGSGYGFGINMNSAVPLELRITYPWENFLFTLSGGVDFADKIGGHAFLGAGYFIINTDNMRLPFSLGLNLSGNNNHLYLGIAGMISYHYVITDNFYVGINLEATYNINDNYSDITANGKGFGTNGIDGSGNPITTFPSPETTRLNHWGTYINIKPTISIGYQLK
jgi:hypothetical protein